VRDKYYQEHKQTTKQLRGRGDANTRLALYNPEKQLLQQAAKLRLYRQLILLEIVSN
jgi:hypothetical protein